VPAIAWTSRKTRLSTVGTFAVAEVNTGLVRTSSPEAFVSISWWISSGEVAMTPAPSTTA
jgi:hypothetical protein